MERSLPFPQLDWIRTSYRQAYDAGTLHLKGGGKKEHLSQVQRFSKVVMLSIRYIAIILCTYAAVVHAAPVVCRP